MSKFKVIYLGNYKAFFGGWEAVCPRGVEKFHFFKASLFYVRGILLSGWVEN